LSKCDVTSSNDQGGLTCKNKIVMVLTINNGWGVCFRVPFNTRMAILKLYRFP
jgi:hypothetical protein